MTTERTILKVTTRFKKGLTTRPYLNLLFLACLALLLPGILFLPFPLLRVPLGLAVIFFAPGNALMKAVFPCDENLSLVQRGAISFGLSVAIVPILALLLSKLPWGVRPVPIALTLSIWTSFLYFIAAIRWLITERPNEEPEAFGLHPWVWWNNLSHYTRRNILFGFTAIYGLFVFAVYSYFIPDPSLRFTEFYMLGANEQAENYPTQGVPGEQKFITVGIANHEGTEVQYRVEVISGTRSLTRIARISLGNGETWENKVSFSVPENMDEQPIDILLYHNNDNMPYRRLRLWINNPNMLYP